MANGLDGKGQREKAGIETRHGGRGIALGCASVRVRRIGAEGLVPAGEDSDQRRIVPCSKLVGDGRTVVSSNIIRDGASRLQADQMPKNLVRRQCVAGGKRDQLSADPIPLTGLAGPPTGLNKDAVQRKRQHRRIVERAGDLLSLASSFQRPSSTGTP